MKIVTACHETMPGVFIGTLTTELH